MREREKCGREIMNCMKWNCRGKGRKSGAFGSIHALFAPAFRNKIIAPATKAKPASERKTQPPQLIQICFYFAFIAAILSFSPCTRRTLISLVSFFGATETRLKQNTFCSSRADVGLPLAFSAGLFVHLGDAIHLSSHENNFLCA